MRTRPERRTQRRLRRLLDDERALDVTVALTDEVMRFTSPKASARALRGAALGASRRGFGLLNATGLRLVAALSRVAPAVAGRVVSGHVRALTDDLILDGADERLTAIISEHAGANLALNINVLGEAVLGTGEAQRRRRRVLDVMGRDDVNYVSVKVSSVAAPLLTFDRAGSRERVSAALREIYDRARATGTFVNLDMEEFRDLRLTLDAFANVVSSFEYAGIDVGVVLQAYLPEAHNALERVIALARERYQLGGGTVKVRLVKGANLAMERVEAEAHGWSPATYATKADVDASYLRLVDRALDVEHADYLRVGVASHNLFHLAWALELARERGVSDRVDVEMLEGMAPAEARALAAAGNRVLLYAPVTRRDDFPSAVAYLVRRLDENTSPDNYLRDALVIAKDAAVRERQQQRFVDAVAARHHVNSNPRRHALAVTDGPFRNEPDGDPTRDAYVQDVSDAWVALRASNDLVIDTLTHLDVGSAGPTSPGESDVDYEEGLDPSDNGRKWYRYRVATVAQVDRAFEVASSGFASWHRKSNGDRAAVVRRCGEEMSAQRVRSIATMSRDGAKTVAEADGEVSEAVDFARYYAAGADGRFAAGPSTPLGVVVVVPPWNFPFAIPAGGVLSALAAGNAVIVKPAPETVAVAYELVSQLWAAGVPRDVLQLVPTRDDECGRHLVTHVGASAVLLTGSFDTALLFASWRPTLRLLAETSGKNAVVVTASADVDLAVKDLVHSAFSHSGQKCSAASLGIIERSLFENSPFVDQLVDAVNSLAVGASYEPSTSVAALIRPPEAALRRALEHLDPGEEWLVEPRPLDEGHRLWRPGIKVGVRPGSWSHLNEWFGPVLGLMIANDLEEATAWQNATPYGLTAGLQSLDTRECEWWLDHVEAGNLYVNRATTGAVVARQPFGGWRRSSVGPTAKAGGTNYLDCLRHWDRVYDVDAALRAASEWFTATGSRAIDHGGLTGERNLVRHRLPKRAVAVRVDESISPAEVLYVRGLVELTGVAVEFSCATVIRGLFDLTLESVDELAQRSARLWRVRWLSRETPPTHATLVHGVTVDPRPLAQAGDVEAARWLLEQSVSITNHRYGNLRAGPKPRCVGLDGGGGPDFRSPDREADPGLFRR